MPITFENIVNRVVPIGIFFFVAALMYRAMKPMFDGFIEQMKKMFSWMGDKGSSAKDSMNYEKVIVYR